MSAENVERAIRAGVVIGDDRVYLLADVSESVRKDERFIAQPCDPDQRVTLTQQCGVAGDNALAVAQLPDADCGDHLDLASIVLDCNRNCNLRNECATPAKSSSIFRRRSSLLK